MATTATPRTKSQGSISDKTVNLAAEKFRLLVDATRLKIIALLANGEHNVSAICELLGQSQPAVSHHLALLRVAGAIELRREGKFNFYSLTDLGQTAVGMIRALGK